MAPDRSLGAHRSPEPVITSAQEASPEGAAVGGTGRPVARRDGRDRDERGRPEQDRPRDRTGRPLPRDTDLPADQLTEEHEYATRDEALAVGLRLWSEHRFFEAHECLEDVWHPAPEEDRAFWKGVIQVAVGCVHDQRGNASGAETLLERAATYLDPYPTPHHGIVTDELRRRARAMAALVAEQGTGVASYPLVPTTEDGPFVGRTRDDGPHPLRDEPAWRSVPRG